MQGIWQLVKTAFVVAAIALALVVMWDWSDAETVGGILAKGVRNLFNAFASLG